MNDNISPRKRVASEGDGQGINDRNTYEPPRKRVHFNEDGSSSNDDFDMNDEELDRDTGLDSDDAFDDEGDSVGQNDDAEQTESHISSIANTMMNTNNSSNGTTMPGQASSHINSHASISLNANSSSIGASMPEQTSAINPSSQAPQSPTITLAERIRAARLHTNDAPRHFGNRMNAPGARALDAPVKNEYCGWYTTLEDEGAMINKFLPHPDLLLLLTSYLDMASVISLYAIDKKFHYLFNCDYFAYIKALVNTWASGSEQYYPWTSYPSFCVRDPHARYRPPATRIRGTDDRLQNMQRVLPGLRWAGMVIYRHYVCRDILVELAANALRCYPFTTDALKRMWFLIDLPNNLQRVTLMRSDYISDDTLRKLTCFFLKLDMRFTNPTAETYQPVMRGEARRHPQEWDGGSFIGHEMRQYLLAEKSLTPLWRATRGLCPDPKAPELPMNRLDMVRLWARHKFEWKPNMSANLKDMTAFGIPAAEFGNVRWERQLVREGDLGSGSTPKTFGPQRPPVLLLRPDELVMREGVRRSLSLHKEWLHMITYGIARPTGEKLPVFTAEQMNEAIQSGKPLKC